MEHCDISCRCHCLHWGYGFILCERMEGKNLGKICPEEIFLILHKKLMILKIFYFLKFSSSFSSFKRFSQIFSCIQFFCLVFLIFINFYNLFSIFLEFPQWKIWWKIILRKTLLIKSNQTFHTNTCKFRKTKVKICPF